jgi:hypothetical protein
VVHKEIPPAAREDIAFGRRESEALSWKESASTPFGKLGSSRWR